ncbi:MAG TPA: lamin tail domain-containing protein, partial [Cyclobacteriaceae bacterium]
MLKKFFLYLALISQFQVIAQLSDDFSDGDFSINPSWSGDNAEFQIISNQLNNNGPDGNGKQYLSTPNAYIDNTTWEFLLEIDVNPSSSNKTRIYLVSDQANLEGDLNGYFIEIGESTDDFINIERQDGSNTISIFSGSTPFSGSISVRIRVTRDASGTWEVFSDDTGGTSFSSEGTFTDNTHTSSVFFGVLVEHTSTRKNSFFFDDFSITSGGGADTEKPSLQTLTVISDTELDVLFSEAVEQASAENVDNYQANNGLGIPNSATRDGGNNSLVHLTFSTAFTDGLSNELSIENIEDLSGNVIDSTGLTFTFTAPVIVNFREVVINEIMPDPNPPIGLPDAEYIELFNRTDEPILLNGWEIEGAINDISGITIPGEDFIVLTDNSNVGLFDMSLPIFGVSFASLTNGGETIILKDNNGSTIDSLQYDGSTGGNAIEQINPELDFFVSINYGNSTDPDGGTPGAQNSIFDNTPDTEAPAIVSVTVINGTQLDVQFNETLIETTAETVGNYSVNNGIGNANSADLDVDDPTLVHLTFNAFQSGLENTLTINNVEDLFGNPINNVTSNFTFIEFSTPAFREVVINELFTDQGGSNPITNDYVELLNTTTDKFFQLDGWTIEDNNAEPEDLSPVVLAPGTFIILSTDPSEFNSGIETMDVSLPNFNNDDDAAVLRDPDGNLIDSVGYGNLEEGISLEQINPEISFFLKSNYGNSTDPDGGTPGAQNSVNDITTDDTTPNIENVIIISGTALDVQFDKSLDEKTASNIENYSVTNIGNPSSAILDDSEDALVHLTFNNSFQNGVESTLSVNNVEDVFGNATNNVSFNFTFVKAELKDIIINEIFADISPTIGLPEEEYVEIYNRSDKNIDLRGYTLNDKRLSDTSFFIQVDQYLIITDDSNLELFLDFGDVLSITSFDALTNSGEKITLKDELNNQVIDSVEYDLSWYGDEEKAEGGYALELINPNLPCSGRNNWTASNDDVGGTPGQENSVFDLSPDIQAPGIQSIDVLKQDSVVIAFDEPMDDVSLLGATVQLDQGINVSDINISPNLESIILILNNPLQSEQFYNVTIQGATDCSGNALSTQPVGFFYDVSPPELLRIRITGNSSVELIFDEPLNEPKAEDEDNYLINSVDFPESARLKDDLTNRISLSFENEFELNVQNTLAISNLEDTVGNVIEDLSDAFVFKDEIDSVVVIAPNLIDISFTVEPSMSSVENIKNYEVTDDEGGQSDDGIGNPIGAIQDDDNPKLIHLLFIDNLNDNDDLFLEVDSIFNLTGELLATPTKEFIYDTRRPTLDSVEVIDEDSLIAYFNEVLDITTAEAVTNYELENNENPVNATLLPGNSSVALIFGNLFQIEIEDRLRVDNIKDVFGNTITSSQAEPFFYDPLAPRIDTVIILSELSLQITFSEVVEQGSSENINNYDLEGINPISARRLDVDSSKVVLLFSNDFISAEDLTLNIKSIQDFAGNAISDPRTFPINTLNLAISSITPTSDSSLFISFSKNIEGNSALNASNYLIGDTLPPIAIQLNNSRDVLLSFNIRFPLDSIIDLTINNVSGVDGSSLSANYFDFRFDNLFEGLQIINNKNLELDFEVPFLNKPGSDKFSVLGIGNPSLSALDGEDPSIIRLFFNEDFKFDQQFSILWDTIQIEPGTLIPAFSFDFQIDMTPPTVDSINSILGEKIFVEFNEPVEEVSAVATNHYEVLGLGNPISINYDDELPTHAILNLEQSLQDGLIYSLIIDRVADLSGNEIEADTITFTFKAPPMASFRDVVINEIFPDPGENRSLPNAEYLELFNASEDTFDLLNWKIEGAGNLLPRYLLKPNEFVILTSNQNVSLFDGLPVVSWNSVSDAQLTNGGEVLKIFDVFETLVDSVSYGSATDGISIEQINPFLPFNLASNYKNSNAEIGGTPGGQNTVFDDTPDTTSPELEALIVLSDFSLELTFDEPLDTTALDPDNYLINNDIFRPDSILMIGSDQ